MTSDKVLWILEDDPGSQFVYEEILGIRYSLKAFPDLKSFRMALTAPEGQKPALILADLRLPDESFLTFLASDDSYSLGSIPFIVVSSVDDLDALRLCFDEGASDYITKPFGRGELVVKIERALSGKAFGSQASSVAFVDPISLTVSRSGGKSVPLTSKEYQIITLIQGSPSFSVSRDELMTRIWGGIQVSEKTLDVHLFNLRKKLAPLGIEIQFSSPSHYMLLGGDEAK